jgi:excisionase family DNA binding protein
MTEQKGLDDMTHTQIPLLTKSDVATLLAVSLSTVNRLLRDGKLQYVKIGSLVRIPMPAIQGVMKGKDSI